MRLVLQLVLVFFSSITRIAIHTIESFQINQPRPIQLQRRIQNTPNHQHQQQPSQNNIPFLTYTKKYTHLISSNRALKSSLSASINEDSNDNYDYLVAIPLEENHDLLLELESVQRGILYHCPLLADSCIMPVSTRMPLLLIRDNNEGGDVLELLQGVIKEVIASELSSALDNDNDDQEEEGITEERRKGGVNSAGIKPIMMKFEGLELEDGITQTNEVLYAIGKEDESKDATAVQLIRNVTAKICTNMNALGYDTRLPIDQPHISKDNVQSWRPRVPFMRLPQDFTTSIEAQHDENNAVATPEEGGNGISPLFWYKWCDDAFTDTIGIRLRTISIYRQSQSLSSNSVLMQNIISNTKQNNNEKQKQPLWTEKMFYIPVFNMALPIGNALLTHHEALLSSNALDRLNDVSYEFEQEVGPTQQQIPQTITSSSSSVSPSLNPSPTASSNTQNIPKENKMTIDNIPKIRSLERYREKLRLLEEQQSSTTISSTSSKTNTNNATPDLPPYPSIEHFAGIWRLVLSTPTNNNEEQPNNPANDNIILRIDGTIAGGPILSTITTTSSNDKYDDDNDDNQNDAVTTYTQKAASGSTWKYYQAQYIGDENLDGNPNKNSDSITTRLRIQLVIPPHKTHSLVLEGEITRLIMPGTTNYLQEFLVSEKENKREESYLQLQGEVWIQSVDLTGERKKMGKFSAVKLPTPDKKQLRYTVPPPVKRSNESQ